jgi:hypothetical protein
MLTAINEPLASEKIHLPLITACPPALPCPLFDGRWMPATPSHDKSVRMFSVYLIRFATWTCIHCVLGSALTAAAHPEEQLQFNRDIRPILSDNCFACHGPDANTREAGLRLDTAEGLRGDEGSDGGVVLPGNAEGSELFQRVSTHDATLKMPPEEFGKELSSEQIALIRRWIEQGATWQGHWSFQPISRPDQPLPADDSSPPTEAEGNLVNPIDQFVLHLLRERGKTFSPEADRRTLVRRLYFDLLGLPAPADVVESFTNNADPLAYEQLVDELLASPHYGERMAMWWLDLVRYADSVGYHGDQAVSVSPFRDYVISAFNKNKPFNQFTIEQLAGDLLPDPTLEQQIAAGYNRLGMMSAEGGVQPKEYLAKYVAERVRNLGGAWLGVTLGCCECHDHKYDPFSTVDFYRFEAFFADIQERGLYGGNDWGPNVPVPNDEQRQRLSELDQRLAQARQVLDQSSPNLIEAQQRWEARQSQWQLLTPSRFESTAGATLTLLEDGSLLAGGQSPDKDITHVWFDTFPDGVTALRLEVLPDPSLPNQGPGRAGNGNFVLSEFEAGLETEASALPWAFTHASATYEQTGSADSHPDKKWTAASAIDGDSRGETWGWAIMEQVGKPQSAVFEIASGGGTSPGDGTSRQLRVVLKQQLDNPQHTLGRFRLWATVAAQPMRADELPPPAIEQLLAIAPQVRTAEQVEQLAAHFRSITPLLDNEKRLVEQLEQQRKELEQAVPTMLITKTVDPRLIRVLPRGNWMDDSGQVVEPGIPELLGGKPVVEGQRLTRLDLAKWVVSPENPLTARVTVNRLWKLYFGVGLSSNLDDLGAQGEWPSHPELLDWLADEFRSSGWNIKQLVKLLVMSRAYRQSSWTSPELAEADPYNRLVARQGRWRLDAEVVRDTLLASSGLLVTEVGGESVKPYQPAGYWAYLNFPQREWENGSGSQLVRRGVYTHWQRQYLYPPLLAFDAPSREECTADRPRSNTPLQALVLLNDPSYVEAARGLALQILRSGEKDDTRRLEWALRKTLARSPRAGELDILLALVADQREVYAMDSAAAEQLLGVGEMRLHDPSDDPVELAAWTQVARTLLNLHETITRN